MNNTWKYRIELKTFDVFENISKRINVDFPSDLKDFIIKNNAASPVHDRIHINGVERVYGETLSFNTEEIEATTYYAVAEIVDNTKYIPFALDPFGNIFCYSIANNRIAFYDHEEQKIEITGLDLKTFISLLY